MPKFSYAYHLHDDRQTGPAIEEFPVATTQTLLAGDLVYLSSGQVTIAGDAQTTVLGVMAQDSTLATAGVMVRVYVITAHQVWKATADADATSHVLAAKKYDINATTQTVDVGDNSAGCIIILKLGASTTEVYIMFTETDLGCVN